MADTFRIATFNAENLFARYRFEQGFEPDDEAGFTVNNLAFDIYNEAEKRITAKAIKEVDADILCLQEVESLPVLERFVARYLAGAKYSHRILIDGNDPRYIDVAVLSRFPIRDLRTHRHERSKTSSAALFSRDCLEADVLVDPKKKPLTLYVNHFKSMMGGRDETKARRMAQVSRVAEILKEREGPTDYKGNFVVLGDFNDYMDAKTSLASLVKHPKLVNVVDRRPKKDQWTHFWAKEKEYRQLDYLLLPKRLDADAGKPLPEIMRMGTPHRAEEYTGPRFDEVGENDPKASDHCPVVVEIPADALV